MVFFHRKTPRAQWLEYNAGMYFITVCTLDKKHYFGTIRGEEMILSAIGKILSNELNNVSTHCPYIEILQSVVMPNHFHALVNVIDVEHQALDIVDVEHQTSDIVDALHQKDTACRVPTLNERISKGITCERLPLLSTFIGGLKSAVTRQARMHDKDFAWQPRYHDHAIRNGKDLNNISLYIENNILLWHNDCFNK